LPNKPPTHTTHSRNKHARAPRTPAAHLFSQQTPNTFHQQPSKTTPRPARTPQTNKKGPATRREKTVIEGDDQTKETHYVQHTQTLLCVMLASTIQKSSTKKPNQHPPETTPGARLMPQTPNSMSCTQSMCSTSEHPIGPARSADHRGCAP
jgi:hypothetical protein